MKSEDLHRQMEMTYDEQVTYLLKKYGPAKYDYFIDDVSWTKSRFVTRTREGLECHHIDEYSIPTLSDPEIAMQHSFSYQKRDRLVYCNLLEHLLLHIKIGRDRFWQNYSKLDDSSQFGEFITHGVLMLSNQINALYHDQGSDMRWEENCYQVISENFDDYIDMLKDFQSYILDHFEPEHLKVGDSIIDSDGKQALVSKATKKYITLQYEDHEEKYPKEDLEVDDGAEEAMDEVRKTLSGSYIGLIEEVYENIS
jgi:hypothetical protein